MNPLYKRILLTVGPTFLGLSFCPTAMAGNVSSGGRCHADADSYTAQWHHLCDIANNDDLLWFG